MRRPGNRSRNSRDHFTAILCSQKKHFVEASLCKLSNIRAIVLLYCFPGDPLELCRPKLDVSFFQTVGLVESSWNLVVTIKAIISFTYIHRRDVFWKNSSRNAGGLVDRWLREEADMTGLEQTNGFRRQGADDILRVMASLWKELTIVQKQ